jgi:hypothetical protein
LGEGPLLPFGSAVQFLPLEKANGKDKKVGTSSVPGILIGYHMNPGGK